MLNPKLVAHVDCDDILADYIGLAIQTLFERTGKRIDPKEVTNHGLVSEFGYTQEQFTSMLIEENFIARVKAFEEAKLITSALKEHGYWVVILTARDYHPRGKFLTQNWLFENEIYYDEVVLTTYPNSKPKFVLDNRMIPPSIIIEDNQHNLEDAALLYKHDFMQFAPKYPWNNPSDIPQAFPWKAPSTIQADDIGDLYHRLTEYLQYQKG